MKNLSRLFPVGNLWRIPSKLKFATRLGRKDAFAWKIKAALAPSFPDNSE